MSDSPEFPQGLPEQDRLERDPYAVLREEFKDAEVAGPEDYALSDLIAITRGESELAHPDATQEEKMVAAASIAAAKETKRGHEDQSGDHGKQYLEAYSKLELMRRKKLLPRDTVQKNSILRV